MVSAVGHMTQKRIETCNSIEKATSGNCEFYQLNNMQTSLMGDGSLKEAIKQLRNLFWIGITEHYDASICLLSYQLGQLNKSKCSCSGWLVRPMNRGPPKYSHSLHAIKQGFDWLHLDTMLYQEAYKIFLLRIYAAERESGHEFLCKSRDGADALDLKAFFVKTEILS